MKTGVKEQIGSGVESGRPQLAVLVDPAKTPLQMLRYLVGYSLESPVDYFFVGGSSGDFSQMGEYIEWLKRSQPAPVVIFPGNELQIHPSADAILLLSLISGRNPELLIGKQVAAAIELERSGLELIPTGYILVESGRPTAVSYISQTLPIPRSQSDLAAATALAGQQLGMSAIYLEAGSGADFPVPPEMIRQVKQLLKVPLLVGGGINSPAKLQDALDAGADLVVVGNVLESQPELLHEFSRLVRAHQHQRIAEV